MIALRWPAPPTAGISLLFMSNGEPFPLYFPPQARRPFEGEDTGRRIARVAGLKTGARVLVLSVAKSGASLIWARDFGCEVVAADAEEPLLERLMQEAKDSSLANRIIPRKVDFQQLSFEQEAFAAALLEGRILYSLSTAVARLRPFLAPRGRLAMVYPVKVGRFPARPMVDFWERRLGESLLTPYQALQVLEKAGFEPESAEAMSDHELGELYREWETQLPSVPDEHRAGLQQELELFRTQVGKAGVSYALLVGRRKEPGEKPPTSRDRG